MIPGTIDTTPNREWQSFPRHVLRGDLRASIYLRVHTATNLPRQYKTFAEVSTVLDTEPNGEVMLTVDFIKLL